LGPKVKWGLFNFFVTNRVFFFFASLYERERERERNKKERVREKREEEK
jgi:hypothetical protein